MPEAPPTGPSRPAGLPPRRNSAVRTLVALILREMSTTYGRTPLGYLWAIMEPVAGIILLTAVFSIGFRSPSIGTNFPLFFASGLLPYMAYVDLSQKTAGALRFSKQLLAYPRVSYMDAVLARLILNAITQFMIFVLVITAILWLYRLDVILDPKAIVLGYVMMLAIATGVGMLNCYLTTMFPVWGQIWGILTRPLLFVSGVIFIYDRVPRPYDAWLWWNPLVHMVGTVRSGIYATYDSSYVSPLYAFLFAGITTTLGLLLLRRYHRDLINQ